MGLPRRGTGRALTMQSTIYTAANLSPTLAHFMLTLAFACAVIGILLVEQTVLDALFTKLNLRS